MSDKTTAAIAAEQQTEIHKAPAEVLPAITLDELEQVDLGTVKATVDDSKLVPWLRENGYGDLVKVEESAKWGELKKLLAYTGEIATIQSTGEIVEGVTAYETPATFTVDI